MNSESTPTPPLAFSSAQMHLKLLWASSAFLISLMSTNCSSLELFLMLWALGCILFSLRPWSAEICSSVFMEERHRDWDYLFHSTWLPELWVLMCLLTLEVLTNWVIMIWDLYSTRTKCTSIYTETIQILESPHVLYLWTPLIVPSFPSLSRRISICLPPTPL